MSIACKEVRESKYWIRLLGKSNYLNGFNNKEYINNEVNIIINNITKIVKTTTQNDTKETK
jgi:four helix bundle protein